MTGAFHGWPLPIPGGVAQCSGCQSWQPAETLTVVSLHGHTFRWCPRCDGQRAKRPDEITLSPDRS